MKILFVHHKAGFQGGAEANVWQVAKALTERGHDAGLVYGESKDESLLDDFLEPFSLTCGFSKQKGSFVDAFRTSGYWRPDVIYVHKLSDARALRVLIGSGIPLVRMVHDHDMYCQRSSRYFPWNRKVCTRKAGYACAAVCGVVRNSEGRYPLKLEWPGKKLKELSLCRKFQTHIVQTEFMKSELMLHEFDESGIHVLPVAPLQDETFVKTDYSEPLVLFVGQILRGKGLDFLIRALHTIRNREWRCLVAGAGSHRSNCEHLARKLGLEDRVRFAGKLRHGELTEACARARLGVVPSVWPEPMGMVGLEFMWAGLPVVGFDVGGIGHWLEDGETGFLVPPRDVKELASKIDRLLADEELASRMGAEARRTAEEKYRHEDYVDRLLEILRGAVEQKSAAGTVEPNLQRG